MVFIALAYENFLDRTQQIARSGLSAEQMPAALKDAAFLAVIGALGGRALGSLGEMGAVLQWFLRGDTPRIRGSLVRING